MLLAFAQASAEQNTGNMHSDRIARHIKARYAETLERKAQIKKLGLEVGAADLPMISLDQARQFALAAVVSDSKNEFYLTENYIWHPQMGFYWIAIYLGDPTHDQWFLIVNRYTGDVWESNKCEPVSDQPRLTEMQMTLRTKFSSKQRMYFDGLRELKPYFEPSKCQWNNDHLKEPFNWPKPKGDGPK